MEDSFQLKILEEDKTVYSGKAKYLSAVTSSGSIGFEAMHEGFAGTLASGSILGFKTKDGESRELTVNWGVLLFHDNKCTVTFA
ncbi:MAG: hypothetical protein PQJ46_13560 [Spirochaetales bacterium]|nr:hypothetical protein [Spirochaetales bacterium]